MPRPTKYKDPKKILCTFPGKTVKRMDQIAKAWGMPRNQVIVMVMSGFVQGANEAGVEEMINDMVSSVLRSSST